MEKLQSEVSNVEEMGVWDLAEAQMAWAIWNCDAFRRMDGQIRTALPAIVNTEWWNLIKFRRRKTSQTSKRRLMSIL